jgi:TatD DNase family protein
MNHNHPIIDTHAHMCDSAFDPDMDAVIQRAKSAGVIAAVCVGEDISDAEKNLALASQYTFLRPAAGLYPIHLDIVQAGEMVAFIRKHRDRLIGIGEVGLDHWVVKGAAEREIQGEIFKMFIHLSLELDLPLNVHSRSAGRHAVHMLLEQGAHKVQLHAFDGKASTATPAVEAGFFFSIPPSIVRSRQKQKLVKQLPLSCLLIETDSPVLAPVPGERNEPANGVYAVKAVSEIKGVPEDEVLAVACENTRRLYGEQNWTEGMGGPP